MPVAVFLSGGIDSPLIAAYSKKEKSDIEGFTLKVDDPILNESDIAKDYAQHLELRQEIVEISENDLIDSIDAHFSAFSEPFGDFSSIPTYVICREAKKKHTVMLSGDGGDELFFGYPRMRAVLKMRPWFQLPYLLRKPLAQITNKLKLTKTWAPYYKSFNEFVMHKHVHLPATILDKAIPNTSFSDSMRALYLFNNSSRRKLLQELRWNEFYAHMQRILIKVDRASMKHSLEVRVPFLDKDLIHYAWEETGTLNTKEDLKKTLKELLAKELPKRLINKEKMGFSVPLYDWLHTRLKADICACVFDKPFYGDGIIEVDVLKQYIQDFFDRKHKDAWGVWHIYAWQKWATIHLDF